MTPVIVISLKRCADRRAKISAALEKLGLPFTFFDAIEGKNLDLATLKDYDRTRRRLFFGDDLLPGEVGCLLSHRSVFRMMVENDILRALILEDDVEPGDDLPEVLRALEKESFDIVRFLCREKTMKASRAVRVLTGRHELTRPFGTPGGAYAYVLTKHAAARLLPFMERNWQPNDILLGQCWRTGLDVYAVRPCPVSTSHDMSISTIGDGRFHRAKNLEGFLRLAHPFARAGYKMWESTGKRVGWWCTRWRDRR